jgi:hypothetical protein
MNKQQDGFRLVRSIHDALPFMMMMMGDTKIYNKEFYIIYAAFKGAFNAVDHRIMFKHMRLLGMPSTFVATYQQLYGVFTTNYNTPYGPTPYIDINL